MFGDLDWPVNKKLTERTVHVHCWRCWWTVQIVTGVVVGVLLLVATIVVVIVVYRKSGYIPTSTHSLVAKILTSVFCWWKSYNVHLRWTVCLKIGINSLYIGSLHSHVIWEVKLEKNRNINSKSSSVADVSLTHALLTRSSADADKPARRVYRSVKVTKHSTIPYV